MAYMDKERKHANCHCDTNLLCTYDHLQLHPLSCEWHDLALLCDWGNFSIHACVDGHLAVVNWADCRCTGVSVIC